MTNILHIASGIIGRYEQELWGVQADAEQPEGGPSAGTSGGGLHEPLITVDAGGDLHLKEQQEAEKLRAEERAREKAQKQEEQRIRAEERKERIDERAHQERENQEERARQERENREANANASSASRPAAAAPARRPEVVKSSPQPVTRGTSSRTSGGTGRK